MNKHATKGRIETIYRTGNTYEEHIPGSNTKIYNRLLTNIQCTGKDLLRLYTGAANSSFVKVEFSIGSTTGRKCWDGTKSMIITKGGFCDES